MPGKNHVFTACVDPVSPPGQRTEDRRRMTDDAVLVLYARVILHRLSSVVCSPSSVLCGGGAGYRPRVRSVYST